jgi:hypothetical protein
MALLGSDAYSVATLVERLGEPSSMDVGAAYWFDDLDAVN